jgi:hypothetical protein
LNTAMSVLVVVVGEPAGTPPVQLVVVNQAPLVVPDQLIWAWRLEVVAVINEPPTSSAAIPRARIALLRDEFIFPAMFALIDMLLLIFQILLNEKLCRI